MKPAKTAIARVIDASRYSFQGIAAGWRRELSGRARDMGSATVFFCPCLLTPSWPTIIYRNFF